MKWKQPRSQGFSLEGRRGGKSPGNEVEMEAHQMQEVQRFASLRKSAFVVLYLYLVRIFALLFAPIDPYDC